MESAKRYANVGLRGPRCLPIMLGLGGVEKSVSWHKCQSALRCSDEWSGGKTAKRGRQLRCTVRGTGLRSGASHPSADFSLHSLTNSMRMAHIPAVTIFRSRPSDGISTRIGPHRLRMHLLCFLCVVCTPEALSASSSLPQFFVDGATGNDIRQGNDGLSWSR